MGGRTAGGRADGAGWLVDPTGRFTYRYHDGTCWTRHVIRDGIPALDPLGPPDPPDPPEPTDPSAEEGGASRTPR